MSVDVGLFTCPANDGALTIAPRDNRLASRARRSSSSSGAEALSHAQHLRGLFPALEQLGYDIDELLIQQRTIDWCPQNELQSQVLS